LHVRHDEAQRVPLCERKDAQPESDNTIVLRESSRRFSPLHLREFAVRVHEIALS
jgi:hypothetical protein